MGKNFLMEENQTFKVDKSKRYWDVWDGHLGKERVKRYPKAYGSPHNPIPDHRRRMELASSLIVGNSVLDVGCGIAHLIPFVKDDVEYVGVDTSLEMIQVAKRFHPNSTFHIGDIYDLSHFRMFDTVLCQSVLIHLPEIEVPIQEMWRHARKAVVFSVPIGSKKIVSPLERYGDKVILMHVEIWEKIEAIIKTLDGVKGVERHLELGTNMDNTYVRIIKSLED